MLLEELAADLVELAVQEMTAAVQESDGHTALAQPLSCLQAQETAANHHCSAVLASSIDQGSGVVQIPKGHHAREILARQLRFRWARTGRKDQMGIALNPTGCGAHRPIFTVDRDHRFASAHLNAVVPKPVVLL